MAGSPVIYFLIDDLMAGPTLYKYVDDTTFLNLSYFSFMAIFADITENEGVMRRRSHYELLNMTVLLTQYFFQI